MAETTLFSVRLPVETVRRLEELAAVTRRSKSVLGAEAIEAYLAAQEWQLKAIKEGIKDLDEGHYAEHSEVKDWLMRWGTPNEKEKPECK